MVCAPVVGGGRSSGKEQGFILQGKGGFLPCCLGGMVFTGFSGTAAIGAVDRKEKILELMGMLTERQKDIVITYFYYGKTQWEIAKELGIAQPTVSQTLMSALRRMRESCGSISNK